VADTGNDRVQVLGKNGKFQQLIGGTFQKGKVRKIEDFETHFRKKQCFKDS
jgi:hypothetical protein